MINLLESVQTCTRGLHWNTAFLWSAPTITLLSNGLMERNMSIGYCTFLTLITSTVIPFLFTLQHWGQTTLFSQSSFIPTKPCCGLSTCNIPPTQPLMLLKCYNEINNVSWTTVYVYIHICRLRSPIEPTHSHGEPLLPFRFRVIKFLAWSIESNINPHWHATKSRQGQYGPNYDL